MKNSKAKRILFFVSGCLLILAVVVSISLLLRHYTLAHIDISQAEEVFLVTKTELIPLEEEETANIIEIFTDAQAQTDNIALLACPFEEAFLFRLSNRDVLLSYSDDDCGVIRMQPVDLGSLVYWFKANNHVEDVGYLQGLYQKYGLH